MDFGFDVPFRGLLHGDVPFRQPGLALPVLQHKELDLLVQLLVALLQGLRLGHRHQLGLLMS